MGTAGNRKGYKVFCFNTTVRNPKRNLEFLNMFLKYDGKVMTDEMLLQYWQDLVRDGLYKLTISSAAIKDKIAGGIPLTEAEISALISNNPQACGISGRVMTELRALKDQGFLRFENATNRKFKISITELGHELINHPINTPTIYTKAMIGTEANNPTRMTNLSKSRPFLNTLYVIKEVNRIWEDLGNEPKGILEHEFAAFVLSMKDCDWKKCADLIIEYRKKFKYKFNWPFIQKYFNDNGILPISNKTLYDYADEVYRKFEMTELLTKHGQFNYIYINFSGYNIEKVNIIIDMYKDYSYISYEDQNEYLKSLYNVYIPWESDDLLRKKIIETKEKVLGISVDANKTLEEREDIVDRAYYRGALEKAIDRYELKFINKELLILTNEINEESKFSDMNEPMRLEYLLTLLIGKRYGTSGLIPGARYDENGLPLSYASSGKCDIVFISSDGSYIFEPTMARNRHQILNNETTNIVRHIREEEQRDGIEFRASMIAPGLHEDVTEFFRFKAIQDKARLLPLSIKLIMVMINENKNIIELNGDFDRKLNDLINKDPVNFTDYINNLSIDADNFI